jgi:hypothetical protein
MASHDSHPPFELVVIVLALVCFVFVCKHSQPMREPSPCVVCTGWQRRTWTNCCRHAHDMNPPRPTNMTIKLQAASSITLEHNVAVDHNDKRPAYTLRYGAIVTECPECFLITKWEQSWNAWFGTSTEPPPIVNATCLVL